MVIFMFGFFLADTAYFIWGIYVISKENKRMEEEFEKEIEARRQKRRSGSM